MRETYNNETLGQQWVTILSVDLEEGCPIWHFSMNCRDVRSPTKPSLLLHQWPMEAQRWFEIKLREAFPPTDGSRRVYFKKTPVDPEPKRTLHAMMKMTREEQSYICDPKWGARRYDQYERELIEELKHELWVRG